MEEKENNGLPGRQSVRRQISRGKKGKERNDKTGPPGVIQLDKTRKSEKSELWVLGTGAR